jgi:hypothetical protein
MVGSSCVLRWTFWSLISVGAGILWLVMLVGGLYVTEDGRVFGLAGDRLVWSTASRKAIADTGVVPGWQPGGSAVGRGRVDVGAVHLRLHGHAPMKTVSLWNLLRVWLLSMAGWVVLWLADPGRRGRLKDRAFRLCRTAEASAMMQPGRRAATLAWSVGVAMIAATYLFGAAWSDSATHGRVYCVMGGELAWTPRGARPSQWVAATWVWAPGQEWGPGAATYLRRTTPCPYPQRVSLTKLFGLCGLVIGLLWGVRWVATKSGAGRRCVHCHYELSGTPAGLPCPECGSPIESADTKTAERASDRLPPKE